MTATKSTAAAVWALAMTLFAAAAAGADEPPAAATDPDQAPAAASAAVAKDLEDLDARVQKGLAALADSMKGFEDEHRAWTALDRSIASARAVNKAVGDRNRLVVALYDKQVAGELADFAAKLKAAPEVYRRLARVRRGQEAAAGEGFERRNYAAMADLCESAAVLCERRYAEVFGDDAPPQAGRARPAATLANTVAAMRKLAVVHDRWEETFAAYPSALEKGELAALFDNMSVYAEDLEAFTKGVEALNSAMRKKAAGGPSAGRVERPAAPADGAGDRAARAGEPRELTEEELKRRTQAAQAKLARTFRPGSNVPVMPPERVKTLPSRAFANVVYVVDGAPPPGAVPANMVYTHEPAQATDRVASAATRR